MKVQYSRCHHIDDNWKQIVKII